MPWITWVTLDVLTPCPPEPYTGDETVRNPYYFAHGRFFIGSTNEGDSIADNPSFTNDDPSPLALFQGEDDPETIMSDLSGSIDDDGSGSTLAFNDDGNNLGTGLFSIDGEGSTTSSDEYNRPFSPNSDQSLDNTNFDFLSVLSDTGTEGQSSSLFSDVVEPEGDITA